MQSFNVGDLRITKNSLYRTTHSIIFIALSVLFGLTACASHGTTEQAAQQLESNNQQTQNQPSQPLSSAEKTKIQKQNSAPLVVKSSQGEAELEPLVVSYPEESFNDPLEFINRPIFAFNDVLYRYALVPVSQGYVDYMPSFIKTGTSNFFSNIDEPLDALNHLFQLEIKSSGTNVARFLINTTIGILGLFDPADAWFDIAEKETSLNDTLASYHVGYGAFLVLPVLGQTDTRNGFSTIVEGLANPLSLTTENPDRLYIQAYGEFAEIAPTAVNYEKLRAQNEDPYEFFRNLYMQSVIRDEQFKNKDKSEEAIEKEAKEVKKSGNDQTREAK